MSLAQQLRRVGKDVGNPYRKFIVYSVIQLMYDVLKYLQEDK